MNELLQFEKLKKIREKNKGKIFDSDKEKLNIESRRYKTKYVLVKGIYRLYYKNELVYIGQSKSNVMKRICDHFSDPDKEFDSFTFSGKPELKDHELDDLEKFLIKKYMPKYNISHNKFE